VITIRFTLKALHAAHKYVTYEKTFNLLKFVKKEDFGMRKTILSVACIILMLLGLFLVSCQKQETATTETATPEATQETPAETGGYGDKAPDAPAGGYGDEAPAAPAGGYGDEAPAAPAGGYGDEAPAAPDKTEGQ